MDAIHLGTSGWSYREWVGVFYPSSDDIKLRYYSKVFDTAEIDSTFYAFPSKGMVYGWTRGTPREFIFSAKLPKIITHEKTLSLEDGVEEDLHRFLELMEPLNATGKLGPILIQLPPSFKRNYEVLEDFLKIIPLGYKFACEFRNRSWWREETWSLLKKYNVANVIVDEPLLAPDVIITSSFSFLRWHGRGKRPWYDYRYSFEELEAWSPRVNRVAEDVKEVYGYFNNHFHGYAALNCLQLLEMLGQAGSKHIEAKKRALNYLDRRATASLLSFTTEAKGIEDLLQAFLPEYKLQRAREIPDSDVSELQVEEDRVEAKIRDYHVLIDSDSRIIQHDCGDWEKRIHEKEFCKHLGKLMLMLPPEKAAEMLRRLTDERDEWKFKLISKGDD